MNRRITSIGFVSAAALAACFGSGPVPTRPSDATVVYVVPVPASDPCQSSTYVSAVGVGADNGYLVTEPYLPSSGCEGSGPTPTVPVNVIEFAKDGSNPRGVLLGSGMAGQSNSGPARPIIATHGPSMVFGYLNGGQSALGPTQTMVSFMDGSGGLPGATMHGLVLDDAAIYTLASAERAGGAEADPFGPEFPCCGDSSNVIAGVFSVPLPLATNGIANATALAMPKSALLCKELKSCLIGNSSTLYFMTTGDVAAGRNATIASATKPSGPVNLMFDSIPSSMVPSSAVPVGFAADETRVVWAAAIGVPSGGPVGPGCWIWSRDLSTTAATLVFQTEQFSCMDAALDATHVYFAIVSSTNVDCGGCSEPIHGDGIGRVKLSDGTFESMDLGMTGPFAGPRRVFIDGDSMYLVDPLVIAKVSTSVLDSRQDILP